MASLVTASRIARSPSASRRAAGRLSSARSVSCSCPVVSSRTLFVSVVSFVPGSPTAPAVEFEILRRPALTPVFVVRHRSRSRYPTCLWPLPFVVVTSPVSPVNTPSRSPAAPFVFVSRSWISDRSASSSKSFVARRPVAAAPGWLRAQDGLLAPHASLASWSLARAAPRLPLPFAACIPCRPSSSSRPVPSRLRVVLRGARPSSLSTVSVPVRVVSSLCAVRVVLYGLPYCRNRTSSSLVKSALQGGMRLRCTLLRPPPSTPLQLHELQSRDPVNNRRRCSCRQ